MANKINKDQDSGQYLHTETVTTATGIAISMHQDINLITVGLIPKTVGTGKVQYTLDSNAAIDASTADWIDWPAGSVSVATVDSLIAPVTAVRCVISSGTMKFNVVG